MRKYNRKAAALSYHQIQEHSPKVTASGKGLTAE